MQTAMNNKMTQKVEGKVAGTLGTIKDIIDEKPELKESLKDVVEAEKQMLEHGMKQVKKGARYIAGNWKTVVPAIAALGIGAYFLSNRSKKNLQ